MGAEGAGGAGQQIPLARWPAAEGCSAVAETMRLAPHSHTCRQRLLENRGLWDEGRALRPNLEAALALALPAKQGADAEDASADCAICYAYRLPLPEGAAEGEEGALRCSAGAPCSWAAAACCEGLPGSCACCPPWCAACLAAPKHSPPCLLLFSPPNPQARRPASTATTRPAASPSTGSAWWSGSTRVCALSACGLECGAGHAPCRQALPMPSLRLAGAAISGPPGPPRPSPPFPHPCRHQHAAVIQHALWRLPLLLSTHHSQGGLRRPALRKGCMHAVHTQEAPQGSALHLLQHGIRK